MTDDEQAKIAEEARKEYEAEKEPEQNQTEESEAEPKSTPEVEEPAKEDAEPESNPDAEKPAEEKKEDEPVKSEVTDEAVNEWALKNGMTTEEAREDLEKTKAIIKKYKSPEEMAKALRSTQSAYDKARSEASKEKEAEPFKPSANPKLEVMTFVDANKEKLIEQYRSTYPARTRDMEDDAILEEVSDKLLGEFNNFQNQQMKAMQQTAAQRREQLFAGLSESDRKFLPDIKAVVDKTEDYKILSKNFNMVDIVRWAKGAKYDADVKAAEERGYKRAKEDAKIVGIVSTGTTSAKVKTSGSSVSLDAYDKRRAKEMFGTTSMTEEEMFKEYADLKKKNRK